MNKQIHYLKYTKKELNEYCKDPSAYVKCINDKLHIGLAPIGLNDFQESVTNAIASNKIGQFDSKYNGIVLDVRNIKVLGNEFKIHNDTSALHINLLANIYVFQPEIGSVVKGVVKHIAHGHLSVTIHRVFNVSIRLAGPKRNFTINTEISVKIIRFDLNDIIPYIEGVLYQIPKINTNKIKFEEKVDDTSGGTHDSGVSTEESTSKRKRKHSTSSEPSSSSSSDSNDIDHTNLVHQVVKIKQEKRSDNSSDSDSEHTDNNAPWNGQLNNQDSGSEQDIVKNIKEEPFDDLPQQKIIKNIKSIARVKQNTSSQSSSSSSSNESDDSDIKFPSIKKEPNDSTQHKKDILKIKTNLKKSSSSSNDSSSDNSSSSENSNKKNQSIIKNEPLTQETVDETTSLTNSERQQTKKLKKRAIKNEPPSSSSSDEDDDKAKSTDLDTQTRKVKKAKSRPSGGLKSNIESILAKCISKTTETEIKNKPTSIETKKINSPTKSTENAVTEKNHQQEPKIAKKRKRDSVANLLATILDKKLNNTNDSLENNTNETAAKKQRKSSVNDKSSDCGGSQSGTSEGKTKKSRKSVDLLVERMIAQKMASNEQPQKKTIKQEKEDDCEPPPAKKVKKQSKNMVESLLNRMISEKQQTNYNDDIIAEPKNISVGNITSFNSPSLSSTLKPTESSVGKSKTDKKKKSKKTTI